MTTQQLQQQLQELQRKRQEIDQQITALQQQLAALPSVTLPATAMESRAQWLISSYRSVIIGGTNPVGTEAQKFGWADTLAQLTLNPADPAPLQRFMSRLTTTQFRFNAAFMPAGAAWILCKFWDRFTSEQRDTCLKKFKATSGFINGHGTENHFLIMNVGAYLWAELWPNETGWAGGRTSTQLRSLTKTRLLTFLRNHYIKGYHEHLSVNYLPVHLYPLHALFNCVKDAELKAAADAVLTLHTADMAANFFQGSTIYPWSRDAEQRASDPQRNTILNTHLKVMYWLYWAELMNAPLSNPPILSAGSRSYGGEARHFALPAALSAWRPSPVFSALAQLPISLTGASPSFGQYGVGDPAYVLRTVHRETRFAAGSANYIHNINDPRPARGAGLSQKNGHGIILSTKKPQHEINVHHPYWRSNANQYRWLSRSSPFQQNAQHQGTIISLFNIPNTDPFAGRGDKKWQTYRNQGMIQQAWVRYPRSMDEQVEAGGWLFLREGETYVAIRCGLPVVTDTKEFPDMTVLRSAGARNAVIVDVATVEDYPSFAAFRQAVLTAPLTIDLSAPKVTYRSARGALLTAQWGPFNGADRIVDSFPVVAVNGQPQPQRDPDFAASRAVMKSRELSVVDRQLSIATPAGRLSVDWRGALPVFSR